MKSRLVIAPPRRERRLKTSKPAAAVNYSVVAPLYNESANLEPLYARLRPVLDRLADRKWELILVDDGSTDSSWDRVQSLQQRDQRVIGLRFSRNFGHHTALTAGLDISRGARVVTMDSDLQDQPEEIPKLAAKMDEGYELVYAERTHRQHSQVKQFCSRVFMRALKNLADVPYPITGAVFRMMTRRFVDELCGLRERHRLFTGLTAWVGFKQTSVEVAHGERFSGQTKYTTGRMLRLAADTVTAFSAKPLYYVIYLGGAVSLCATFFGIYVIVRYFITGFSMAGWASLMTAITFFSGTILFTLGAIGQYVARVFEQSKDRPLYIVEAAVWPSAHPGMGQFRPGESALSDEEVPRQRPYAKVSG
jgi:glycosyltransferase involved in cell wall biosynthesis